jgi:hypothetical protein
MGATKPRRCCGSIGNSSVAHAHAGIAWHLAGSTRASSDWGCIPEPKYLGD